MKKVASFLLCIVLVLMVTISIAEEEPKTEILFRKIPWKTSATDFLNLMKKDNLGGSISECSYLKTWEMIDGKDEYLNKVEDMGYYYHSYPKKLEVAGVPVSSIYAYFIFTYDEDDVYKEENKSSLYKANYTLEPVDIGATFPILASKLSSLYGEGTPINGTTHYWSTGEKGDYTENIETIVWQGANNTAVRLYMESKTYDNEKYGTEYINLILEYGLCDSDDLFTELTKAIAAKQTKDMLSNDDTDGL